MNDTSAPAARISKQMLYLVVGIGLACGLIVLAVWVLLMPMLSDQKAGGGAPLLPAAQLAVLPKGPCASAASSAPDSFASPTKFAAPPTPTNPNGLSDTIIQDRVSNIIRRIDKKSPKSIKGGVACAPELLADELDEVERTIKDAAEPYGAAAMSARQLRSIILTITGRPTDAADELQNMLGHASGGQDDQIRFHLGVLLAKSHLGARADALLAESRKDPHVSRPSVTMLVLFDSAANTELNKTFPDFVFDDLKGVTRRLDDYRGKVVVLDLWSSNSVPCATEMPNLVKLYARYHPQGLEMLGIDCDRFARTKDRIFDTLTWPQVTVSPVWASAPFGPFGATATPTMFVIGADGILLAQERKTADLVASIEAALAKMKATAPR